MKLQGLGLVALSSSSLAQYVDIGTLLDPVQPVLLPDAERAKNPLAHLGANGPWHIGELHLIISCAKFLYFDRPRCYWHLF